MFEPWGAFCRASLKLGRISSFSSRPRGARLQRERQQGENEPNHAEQSCVAANVANLYGNEVCNIAARYLYGCHIHANLINLDQDRKGERPLILFFDAWNAGNSPRPNVQIGGLIGWPHPWRRLPVAIWNKTKWNQMTLSQRWSECIELAACTQRTPLSLVIFFFYSCLYCFEKYLLFVILKLTFATFQILSFWNWKPTCMGPMSACSGMSTWHLHALYALYAFACPLSKNNKTCVCVHLCVLLCSLVVKQQRSTKWQADASC